ncbi:unnamed protein product [Mytilus coruscus]|uniref:Uncharacterized protein n=1 Tax=Mytilus coruscus TaxID=42192 RepID=A0A6J8AR30_MYTCO|nr:unnamed protein product [Mytilus coruscus]
MDETEKQNDLILMYEESAPVPPCTATLKEKRSSSQSSKVSVRTNMEPEKKSAGKKANKASKSANMQAECDKKLNNLEENFNHKFNKLSELFASSNQNREFLPRSECNVMGNLPSGERRPVISLEPDLDQDLGLPRVSRNIDIDTRSEISLHVQQCERNDLDIRSNEESVSGGSPFKENTEEFDTVNNRKCERFIKHVNVQSSNAHGGISLSNEHDKSDQGQTNNNVNFLSKIFKEDIVKERCNIGLVLDQAQVEILENSWRPKNPDRISAFKEDYKNCFPIHDSSVEFVTSSFIG